MEKQQALRIDKWLWAVRLYRTRTLASEACRAGHVRVGGRLVKPARDLHPEEIVTAQIGPVMRTVKVLGLIERRVGARLVPQFLEDLTPQSEYEKARSQEYQPVFVRPKGAGRPTKKQRRVMLGLRAMDEAAES